MTPALKLAHGLSVADLYRQQGLARLDGIFLDRLARTHGALHAQLLDARAATDALPASAESALLLELAPILESFLIELFGIADAAQALAQRHADLSPLYEVKRQFVQRQAAKVIPPEEAAAIDGPALLRMLAERMVDPFDELAFARRILDWQSDKAGNAGILETARQYAAWAVHTPEGRRRHGDGILFKVPSRTDPMNLVPNAVKGLERHAVILRNRVTDCF